MLPDWAIDPDKPRTAPPPTDTEPGEHGPFCTERCKELAVDTGHSRPKFQEVTCSFCDAAPGQPCWTYDHLRRRVRLPPGREHPSRRGAAR